MTSWTTPSTKNRKLLQLALAVALAVCWTSLTSRYLVSDWHWNTDKIAPVPMWISQIFSVPLLSIALLLIANIRSFDKKLVFLYFCYATWFVVLFLSFAPGCMTEDSYYTFHMVKNGWWGGWYSPLHPVLITGLIQILPIGFFAPGFFLALFCPLPLIGLHKIISDFGAKKWLHVVPALFLLMPAQILTTLIIVRDSYFTVFYLCFSLLIFTALVSKKGSGFRRLFFLSLIGAALSVYRLDAFPGVALGLILLMAKEIRKERAKGAYVATMSAIAIPFVALFLLSNSIPMFFGTSWVVGNTWDPRTKNEYKLTLIENPLGYIVKSPTHQIAAAQRASIEKVFKFSDLAAYHCPENICVFYGGFWNRGASQDERNDAFKSAIAIFAANPGLFIESRIDTLNAVGERNAQTICSRETMIAKGYPPLKLNDALYDFGQLMVNFVKKTEAADGVLGGARVWWNVYFWMAVCVAITASMMRTPASSIIALMLLGRTLAVAVAAPAGFTLYYLTLFIGGPIVLTLWFLEFSKYRAERKQGAV